VADTKTTEGTGGEQQGNRREVTLHIDQSSMETTYCNQFMAEPTLDEVLLYFGMNRTVPGKNNEIGLKIEQQVVLNWRNAKRLGLSLANLVRQHEERYGEIDLNLASKGAAKK